MWHRKVPRCFFRPHRVLRHSALSGCPRGPRWLQLPRTFRGIVTPLSCVVGCNITRPASGHVPHATYQRLSTRHEFDRTSADRLSYSFDVFDVSSTFEHVRDLDCHMRKCPPFLLLIDHYCVAHLDTLFPSTHDCCKDRHCWACHTRTLPSSPQISRDFRRSAIVEGGVDIS